MSAYLDASVLMSALADDGHSARAQAWLLQNPDITFSRWTVVECSSALSISRRIGRLTEEAWAAAERKLDAWVGSGFPIEPIMQADFDSARALVRNHRSLRAPDALHLALARRTGHVMASFDRLLVEAAVGLGLEVADLSP